jgi:hypothetical protein
MTKGEQELRKDLLEAMYLESSQSRFDAVDNLIHAIKSGEYFIHLGEICEVSWDNPVDWEDGKISYSILAEDPEPEEYEELED